MNMLRNIKLYFSALALLLGATSCLEKYPESAFQEKDAMRTFADAEQTLTGLYASLKSGNLFSGSLTLMPDIQADLVYAVEGNTNPYGEFWRWDIRPTNLDLDAVYADLYAVITRCNFYLDRIGDVVENEINDTNIETLEQYTGEVYTIRALCYSELLKCFCKAYDPATAKSELGVVIRTKYFTPEPIRRASLYDSYEFVLSDLAEAEKRLDKDKNRASYTYMSLAAAEALHARVALYMQDWDKAIEYSSILIDKRKDTFALADTKTQVTADYTAFDYMWGYDASDEIIWRIGFTETSYGGALGSVFLNFNRDYYYFYPDYIPGKSSLDLYDEKDLRLAGYFYETETGYQNQFSWPLLVKYYGNRDLIDKLIYHVSMPKVFRLAEQYLIRAEAYCRKNDFSKAGNDLTTLRKARYASGGTLNVTKDNWLDNISDERVRELYMEGFRLHDLKRWGRGFERKPQANTQKEASSLKIEPNNPLFVWPIPQHELEAPGSEILPNESNK